MARTRPTMRMLPALLVTAAGCTATMAHADGPSLRQPSMAFVQPSAGGSQPPPEQPSADGRAPAIPSRQGPPTFSWNVGVRSIFALTTDLKDGGDVSITRVGPTLGAAWIFPGAQARLSVTYSFEYSNYDWSGNTGFVAGRPDPWSDIYRHSVSAIWSQQVDEKWSYFVGGLFGAAYEDGASPGDALEFGVLLGFSYALSPELSLGLGVGVLTQIEDDPLVIPIPTVDWRINQQFRLTNNSRPGLFLIYTPAEAWTITLGAEYTTRDFRLDENGPVPDGVGRDRRFPVLVEVAYRPERWLEIAARAGVDLGVRYWLSDSEGNEITTRRADPTPFFGLGATLRF